MSLACIVMRYLSLWGCIRPKAEKTQTGRSFIEGNPTCEEDRHNKAYCQQACRADKKGASG